MESRLSLGPPFRSTVPSRCSVLRVIYPRQAIAPSKANVQAVAIRGSGPADKITAPSLNLDLRCERHRALRISCILQWLVGQGLGPLGFCRSRQELQVRPGTEWWKHMRVMPDLGQDLSERCDSCPQEIQLALLSWPASLHVATGQGEVEWYSLAQGCQWSILHSVPAARVRSGTHTAVVPDQGVAPFRSITSIGGLSWQLSQRVIESGASVVCRPLYADAALSFDDLHS